MHVFMEKPLFVDAAGYRSVMETNKMADQKNLKVAVGLQRRYEPHYTNWMEKLAGGAIGDISYSRVYWNSPQIWCKERKPEQTEVEWQMDNWYHFLWLCGDNICEQHVHNIDIGLWAHGKGDPMSHPVEANAQGGRQNMAGPMELLKQAPPFSDKAEWFKWYTANKDQLSRYGQAWDHFFVEFTFADGSRMFSQCRHVNNCWNSVDEHIHGTQGYGRAGVLYDKAGKEIWKNTEKAVKGPYQWEHDVLVDAIRNDKPRNDGYYSAMATMSAVLGRTAAFSGHVIKWDDCVEKMKPIMPVEGVWDWNAPAPVMPDANGFYESSVAKPGQFKWDVRA
jgi:predicted dehydrogenase